MSALRGVAAILAFALEITMLAAFAIWALHVLQPAVVGVALAIVVDGVVIAVWGGFLAPRSTRRLRFPARVVVELALESASALALWAAGQEQSAVIFGVLIAVRFGLGLASGADKDGL
jgi:hypothetical protein